MHATSRSAELGEAWIELVIHLVPFVMEDSKGSEPSWPEPGDPGISLQSRSFVRLVTCTRLQPL